MSKIIGTVCTSLFLVVFAAPQKGGGFSKYRPIEVYEVRPGILMMPRYADDGQVCEMVVEKQHYSNNKAYLDSTIPREVITRITDELVPASERGAAITNAGKAYISAYTGNSVTSFADYENVSINVYGKTSSASESGDIVAVVHWKNRKCAR